MRTNNENENVNAPVGVYKCISEKGGRSKRACEDVIQIKKVFFSAFSYFSTFIRRTQTLDKSRLYDSYHSMNFS